MKIKQSQLSNIIKESIKKSLLNEYQNPNGWNPNGDNSYCAYNIFYYAEDVNNEKNTNFADSDDDQNIPRHVYGNSVQDVIQKVMNLKLLKNGNVKADKNGTVRIYYMGDIYADYRDEKWIEHYKNRKNVEQHTNTDYEEDDYSNIVCNCILGFNMCRILSAQDLKNAGIEINM